MEATIRMLGTRLQEALRKREELAVKAGMLEGIVQSLQAELDEKKKLIKQLTGGGSGADIKSDVSRTVAAAGNDVKLLRSLLESALADSARIKHDMRLVGQELTAAEERASRTSAEKGALEARLAEAEAATAAARRDAEEAAAAAAAARGFIAEGRGSGFRFSEAGDDDSGTVDSGSRRGSEADLPAAAAAVFAAGGSRSVEVLPSVPEGSSEVLSRPGLVGGATETPSRPASDNAEIDD
jgi:hypothetical protein